MQGRFRGRDDQLLIMINHTVLNKATPIHTDEIMRARRIRALGLFDWIFDGEADLSFPIAVERRFRGNGRLDDIVGLTWRDKTGYHNNAEAAASGTPMTVAS